MQGDGTSSGFILRGRCTPRQLPRGRRLFAPTAMINRSNALEIEPSLYSTCIAYGHNPFIVALDLGLPVSHLGFLNWRFTE